MDVLQTVLLIAHFIALAAILGPWLSQLKAKAKSITMTMVWGARAQLIIGLGLAAIVSMGDGEVNHMKLGIKAVVALAVVALAEIGRKRENNTIWWLVGLLTVINTVVAVVV